LTLEERRALKVFASLKVVDGLSAEGDEEVAFFDVAFFAIEHKVCKPFGADCDGEKGSSYGDLRKVYIAKPFHDEQVVTMQGDFLGIGA
ncbi:hypothetical protein, partial [Vibrio alginolyticus]|uniref:hypothetical protein n=1 Tax=Vibrio alginolyticus TaxID=663 RepID=UPI00406952A4